MGLGSPQGPQEVAPRGGGSFLGPLRLGILHYAALLPLRGFAKNFEPSISRILGFMAQGCFGTLRGGSWGYPRFLTLGHPPPFGFFLLRNFDSEYEHSMNLLSPKLWFSWLRAVLGLFFGAIGTAQGVSQVLYAWVSSTMRLIFL